jgi:hypothetical protein
MKIVTFLEISENYLTKTYRWKLSHMLLLNCVKYTLF